MSFTIRDAQDAGRRAGEPGGGAIPPPSPTAPGDIAVVRYPAGATFGLSGETRP